MRYVRPAERVLRNAARAQLPSTRKNDPCRDRFHDPPIHETGVHGGPRAPSPPAHRDAGKVLPS